MARGLGEFTQHPGLGHLPVTHHGLDRDPECVGRLFHAEAAEKAHLHHARFAFVDGGQRLERVVERDEVAAGFEHGGQGFIEGDANGRSSALLRTLRASHVDEDAPHLPGVAGKQASRRRWSLRHYAGMAVAAVSLCLAVLFVPTLFVHIKAEYQTSTAESRTITLEDGSRVQLAAASALTTDFANGRRNVKVLKGEAFFDVVPDSDRPFVVEAKNLTVQVLGTAFDVDMTDGVTQVALAHGSVEASFRNAPPTRLVPGEMLVVDASGAIRKETVPVEDIGGWRNGELYVVDATIGSVVEQIQRYHPAWLTMADKTLAEQRVTGFYNLRDPDRALEALVEPYKGKVHAIANTARIITRF